MTQDVGISQLTNNLGAFSNQWLFVRLHCKRDDRTLFCLGIGPNWFRYVRGFLLKKPAYLLGLWIPVRMKTLAKCLSNSVNNRLENIAAVVKPYFLFGWVYVDIDI